MFGKVIVFGLFEMIKKKKTSEDCVPGSGFDLRVRSSKATQAATLLARSLRLFTVFVQVSLLVPSCGSSLELLLPWNTRFVVDLHLGR